MGRSIGRGPGLAAVAGALLYGTAPALVFAQDSLPPWEGGLTVSLGQPSKVRTYAGASAGWDAREGRSPSPVTYGVVGLNRPLASAVTGAAGVVIEAFGGMRSAQVEGGVRGLFEVPTLRISGGVEYNVRENRLGPLLAVTHPVRRGGILGSGSLLRGEWSPGAGQALRLSVLAPFGWPAAGETRPRTDRLHVPPRPRGERVAGVPGGREQLSAALDRLDERAALLELLILPRVDPPGGDPRRPLLPLLARLRAAAERPEAAGRGVGTEAAVRAYHEDLERAFTIAITADADAPGVVTPAGRQLTRAALAILREHVLYPYDRALGQWKTRETIDGLATYARGSFAYRVVQDVPREREQDALYAFERLLATVTAIERRQRRVWGDSRLVWLPLQLGLRAEDHDTQAELDAIVEDVTGVQFSDGNRIRYIINQEFQQELIASIHATRDYHVLWVHDFRGRNEEGDPDSQSMETVLNAYLGVLAASAAAYDSTHHVPVFMIFIDQHYYDRNRARLWFDVLERPLEVAARLERRDVVAADSVRAAQQRLRTAVARSRLLQAERRQYGDEWLNNLFKVHISVTNPADHSFSSPQIMPLIGMPDNVIRDHRKIVFHDISEEDPYRGAAVYTGMGVGEHYTSSTWEDRALRVEGPAALSLKTQARLLLESQGIRGERLPWPLRPRPLAPGYRDMVAAEMERAPLETAYRAVELHNQTGFLEKQVTVARAVLFTLMPPGSVIKVPDSLWGSGLFAGMLTGSALRGCRVLFIAPSRAAAPSSGMPQMARAHSLFTRLIVIQQELGPELDAGGGMLKTGMYHPGVGVEDNLRRFANAYTNARRTPFLRRLFPVNEQVDRLLKTMGGELLGQPPAAETPAPLRTNHVVMPKLHLKANFFASREAWDSLVARVEIADVLAAYLLSVSPEVEPLLLQLLGGAPPVDHDRLALATMALDSAFRATLSPAEKERVLYFVLMGSANADYRSMQMDGEASVLLSGWAGIIALIDFGLIANMSVWIDDLEMLDALLPPPNAIERGLSYWLRYAL